MGGVAEAEGTADRLREGHLERSRGLPAPPVFAVEAVSLELECTQPPGANGNRGNGLDLRGDRFPCLAEQAPQFVGGRTDGPAVSIELGTAITMGFGMARGE